MCNTTDSLNIVSFYAISPYKNTFIFTCLIVTSPSIEKKGKNITNSYQQK